MAQESLPPCNLPLSLLDGCEECELRTYEESPVSPKRRNLSRIFRKVAQKSGKIVGSPWSFVIACLFVLGWLFTGPLFHFSTTWQLVINTTTTIVTFIMVFLLQNTQNRDTKALHLKLDELIYVHKHARNLLMEAEELLDDEEMEQESRDFRQKRESSAY